MEEVIAINVLFEANKRFSINLEMDNLNIFKWLIDVSYAVHKDMKSHTGGVLTLGKGAVYSRSTK